MKPIPLYTEEVQAILDRRKTAMRRAIKPQPWCDQPKDCGCAHWNLEGTTSGACPSHCISTPKSPYKPGDILYVQETWATKQDDECKAYKTGICPYESCDKASGTCFDLHYIYKAADSLPPLCGWRPSIHMPLEAARIFLLVRDVQVEPLWNMRLKDCLEEGVILTSSEIDDRIKAPLRARERYSAFWDDHIKPIDREKYGWKANPWVRVIRFDQISKEEAIKNDGKNLSDRRAG